MYQIEILRNGVLDQEFFLFSYVAARKMIGQNWEGDCYVRVFHNGRLLRYLEVEEIAMEYRRLDLAKVLGKVSVANLLQGRDS